MDDALSSHNTASVVGNTLVVGGLLATGIATWMWFTAPHVAALGVSPTEGGAMATIGGRF